MRGTLVRCMALLVLATAGVQAKTQPAVTMPAPDVYLQLNYHTINIGADGVQREVSYQKLMYRQGNRIWIEKTQPKALLDSAAHGHAVAQRGGTHAGHAHTLAQDAPLMVTRQDDGQVLVQVILRQLELLIDVERGHQGNVGYNGSWEATYWVIPPTSLAKLQPVGTPRDGVQIYRRFEDESMTEVVWDIDRQYPIRVLRRGPHDMTYYLMTAEEVAPPQVLPWTQLAELRPGDYSDLLD